MRRLLLVLLTGLIAALGLPIASAAPPNILLIYADDLGPGLLGCYGQQTIETPHIDRLAQQGLRFTDFYGANVCAPARASLMSGLHTGHAIPPTKGGLESSLHSGEITEAEFNQQILLKRPVSDFDSDYLGEVARKAGYRTSYFGKLGVGFTDTHEMMREYGFDDYVGLLDSVICWSFYPEYYWENDRKVTLPGNPKQTKRTPNTFSIGKASMTYSEDVWLKKALVYLDAHGDEPFFMVYASQLPHGPVSIAPKDYRYQDRTEWAENERIYASMIDKLDCSVGALMNKLDALGLAENTLVLFTSDNGHEPSYYRSAKKAEDQKYSHKIWDGHYRGEDRFLGTMGRRGSKRYNFDGGIQVPLIARWPGKITAAETTGHRGVGYDLMPTIAELCGVTIFHEIDGVSLLPILLNQPEAQEPHQYLFWKAAGQNNFSRDAIVAGDWKLVEEKETQTSEGTKNTGQGQSSYRWALYDLKNDSAEKEDLAGQHPERVQALLQWVHEARQPIR